MNIRGNRELKISFSSGRSEKALKSVNFRMTAPDQNIGFLNGLKLPGKPLQINPSRFIELHSFRFEQLSLQQ